MNRKTLSERGHTDHQLLESAGQAWQQGDLTAARKHLQEALRLNPQDSLARATLEEIAQQTGAKP